MYTENVQQQKDVGGMKLKYNNLLRGIVSWTYSIKIGNGMGKGREKVLPRIGHKGPEEEQMYSSTLPSTLALDGGGWSMPCPSHLSPRKDPVPIV